MIYHLYNTVCNKIFTIFPTLDFTYSKVLSFAMFFSEICKYARMKDFSLQLFTVYEEHLRQSSVVVAEEQNQLSRNLRETDQTVAQILGR